MQLKTLDLSLSSTIDHM